MAERSDLWKMTALGVLVAAATAVVTGLVVANQAGVNQEVEAPPAQAAPLAPSSTPPRSVTEACNRQAAARLGDRRDRRSKSGTLDGIWDNKKHDQRFRTAYSSCMKSRGYGA